MPSFEFQKTSIADLTLITPLFVPDDRGWFSKTFEKSTFAAHGIKLSPWEELRSCSKKGTLRGLHFQRRHSQDKLVRVPAGEVYDVAVDLRPDSPTFGKWQGFYLSADNRKMLYIPKQFAHGFLVLSQEATMCYLCGDRYDPESDGGIRWNDPQVAVQWPIERVDKMIQSEKDAALPTLAEFLVAYGSLPAADDQ